MSSTRLLRLPLLLVAALYLPGAGCNLFETRQPDVSSDILSVWEPPTSPEIVVRNLENAFESGTFNNYRRTMTEDFVFVPDEGDVATLVQELQDESIYANWDRDVETATAEEIRGSAEEVRLDLTNPREELDGAGRLRKYLYVLTVVQGDGAVSYEGEVWFRIRQEPSGEWLIFAWEDKAISETADSWGLLKGRSRL